MRNALCVTGLLVVSPALVAQSETATERIVRLIPVLAGESPYPSDEKLQAIRQLLEIGAVGNLGADLLFDRANARYEADPIVRREAVLGLPTFCNLRNRVVALRLARCATPDTEPDPRVRIAALQSLARFESGEAGARIMDSTLESREPDPEVRAFARRLLAQALAGPLN